MTSFSLSTSMKFEAKRMVYHSPDNCNETVKWLDKKNIMRTAHEHLTPSTLVCGPGHLKLMWIGNWSSGRVTTHRNLFPLFLHGEWTSLWVLIFSHGTIALNTKSGTTPFVYYTKRTPAFQWNHLAWESSKTTPQSPKSLLSTDSTFGISKFFVTTSLCTFGCTQMRVSPRHSNRSFIVAADGSDWLHSPAQPSLYSFWVLFFFVCWALCFLFLL